MAPTTVMTTTDCFPLTSAPLLALSASTHGPITVPPPPIARSGASPPRMPVADKVQPTYEVTQPSSSILQLLLQEALKQSIHEDVLSRLCYRGGLPPFSRAC